QLTGAVGVLDEAGLGTDLQRQGGGSGSFQILTEKLRLSLPADMNKRRAELRRELSDVGGAEAEAALESLEGLGRAWDDFLREPAGAAQLAEVLRQKCAAAGGDVVADQQVEQLRVEKKGVVFQLGGSEVRAACVVLACSAEKIAAMVQGGARAERKIADEAA